jgi:UDP:flavonoid glycosyltransferase YjiC (YdhE family)
MRALFTTTPGRGHFQPMLPLARALTAAGHELRWAAPEEVCVRLRRDGLDAVPCGYFGNDAATVPPPPEVAALPITQRPDYMFSVFFGPRRAAPMLADLVPVVEDWRPDLLICEQAELAGPIAAARAGVPNVTHAFGRLLPERRVARAGEAMAELWRAHGLEPRPYAGTYDHLYLDIYPPSLQNADTAHLGDVQLVRPAEPLAPVQTDAPPLVYVTFGTVFNTSIAPFAEVVEAARELPVRVVVTLGPGNDPASLGEQPANVTVAEFIPQEHLLPECAVVVSHAGSGTFLAALAAGVPQVLIPLAADQFLNAAAGAAGGVGVAVDPGTVSVTSVRAALEHVLADAQMRGAAARTSAEIATMPAPEAVADELARRFG